MEKILITGASSGIIKKVIEKLNDTYYIYTAVHTSSEEKYIKLKKILMYLNLI